MSNEIDREPSHPRAIRINGRCIQSGLQPYLLAEMACAHDGQVERVLRMIHDAADAGFDGIQFQLFSTERLLTPHHRFFEKVRRLEIPYASWRSVFEAARMRRLSIFVNPLSIDAFAEIRDLGADALKIHSADLSNPEMLHSLAEFKLPVLVGVGGSTIAEIRHTLDLLSSIGISDLIVMHGFQGYPTKMDDTNLNCIPYLREKFEVHVGYQDHIDGDDEMGFILPATAAAMGAALLEKHITDDRARRGTDFESALDRDGQARFVRIIRDAHRARGTCKKDFLSDAEVEYRKTFKKSLVASRDIAQGEILETQMISSMRGDVLGLTPSDLQAIIGKKTAKPISKFSILQADDFLS